jgi:hypothetical protein
MSRGIGQSLAPSGHHRGMIDPSSWEGRRLADGVADGVAWLRLQRPEKRNAIRGDAPRPRSAGTRNPFDRPLDLIQISH